MINAQDIKIGTCIRMDGKLYFCIDFLHVKPGKGNTFMRTKLKDVVNGYVLERRFNIGEKLEDVRVERRPHQYLYHDGDNYQFMNQETFDQIPIAHDLINGVDFLLEGMIVDVVSDASTETVLYADVPIKVQQKITGTERRHSHQHAEARHSRIRRHSPRPLVHQRRRDYRNRYARRFLRKPRKSISPFGNQANALFISSPVLHLASGDFSFHLFIYKA